MDRTEKAKWLIRHPVELGKLVGYNDLTPMHGEWIDKLLYGKEDMTLQAHRGSYKTTCLCIAIAIMMIRFRERNIIFLRKTDSDIHEVISNVRRILTSDIVRQVYTALTGIPMKLTKDSASELTLSIFQAPIGSAQLRGIGINGSLTGKHGDIIITDDIINLKDRASRAERDRTKAVYMELQNIRNPGGRIINTGTPWHVEDAFTLMPEPYKYDCYTTGLLSKEQIEVLRQQMAPSLFAANYELQHIAAENALFTTPPRYTKDVSLLRDGIAHVDAAYGGDDSTAFTCGKRRGDTLYLYGRMWHGHVDTVLDVIISECRRLQCGPIMCESNADKCFLAKEIQRGGFRARTYNETENKYIKISTYLRKWWGNIVWLDGTDRDYIDQIMDYTEDAEHDDAPDSAAVMCRWFDRRSGNGYMALGG